MYSRSAVVKQMQAWIGASQGDSVHKKIIDTYNGHKPLARGYKVTYTDAWCATTVSAAFIACGYTKIYPTECGCEAMIKLCISMGIWVENDAYVPSPGDVIFYDWDDNGKGDCTGHSDHVGVVETVKGNLITVIEGNKSKKVGRRTLEVNGRYIRGYATPRYDKEEQKKPETDAAAIIWNYLMGNLKNAYGVAGLMGNLKAESNLRANNLQDTYEAKFGLTDIQYTAQVDDGIYKNFVKDSAGYGLAQWTYYTRKQNLIDYAKSKKASIADLQMQLEFLWSELQGSYKGVLNTLKNAKSVKEASDCVLTQFERPKNQGDSVKKAREQYGLEFYTKYAGKAPESPQKEPEKVPGTIKKVQAKYAAQKYSKSLAGAYKTTANLNLRTGAGTDKAILVEMPKGSTVKNYGYYSDAAGVKWLYVVFTKGDTEYTGFCSSKYLSK